MTHVHARPHRITMVAIGCSLAASVAACGGGSSTATSPVPAPVVTAAALEKVPITLTIRIPSTTADASSSAKRAPDYISSAIVSIDFRLTGVTPASGGTYTGALDTDTLIQVTPNSGNCSLVNSVETCTATTTAPAPATDVWTIYTYATATPTVGTTTPLSVYSGYTLPVSVNGPNVASVSTYGVPASLVFSPSGVSIPASVALSGSSALPTSVQVQDAGGATLIGGNAFADASGNPGNVAFTGCDGHLTPNPASFSAADPAALGSGGIAVAYDGLASSGSTLTCSASAPGGLTATYAVALTTGSGSIDWNVNAVSRK